MIAKDKTSLIYELRAPTWQSQSRKSPAEDESENKKEKKIFRRNIPRMLPFRTQMKLGKKLINLFLRGALKFSYLESL